MLRKWRPLQCDSFGKRDKDPERVLLRGGLIWGLGLSRKPEWVQFWSLGLSSLSNVSFQIGGHIVNTVEGGSWFPLASAFPHMRFLGKVTILGAHCLNSLIAQEDTRVSLECLSSCQDGDRTQSNRLTVNPVNWYNRGILDRRTEDTALGWFWRPDFTV